MKTLPNRAALTRHLVQMGATAEIGGRVLNATAAQGEAAPPPKPVAAPAQIAPAPLTAADVEAMLMKRDAEWQQRMNQALAELRRQIDQHLIIGAARVEPSAPAWHFAVELDSAGQITGLTATPEAQQPTAH